MDILTLKWTGNEESRGRLADHLKVHSCPPWLEKKELGKVNLFSIDTYGVTIEEEKKLLK